MPYRSIPSTLVAVAAVLCACSNEPISKPSCPPTCIMMPVTAAQAGNTAPPIAGSTAAQPPITSGGGSGGVVATPPLAGASGAGGTAGSVAPAMDAGTPMSAPLAGAGSATAGSMATAGSGGVAGAAGTAGSANPPGMPTQRLPPVSDYGARGPFQVTTVNNTGPDGQYTLIRPRTLGMDGFEHPPATWGNGITTTPALYTELLDTIASHGFVIIASNSTGVTAAMMTSGLDWLLAQNDAAGELQGKLDVARAASIGYSLGGGAAVTTGKHPAVIVTVSMHGLTGTSGMLHGPLLLFTSTGDTFVSAAQFVDPTFRMSAVQTFYATLTGGSHLTPLGDAADERAPMVAWLRLWVYGDEAAKKYFYGDDCLLCKAPWTMPQRKNF